jgi:catechol 1,2-dioxygenase
VADGFKPVTTQIFDGESKYLEDDSVFAVKTGLMVKFTERKGDPEAKLELEYNIQLAPADR